MSTVVEVRDVELQESALHAKITVAEALALFASFYPAPADPAELLAVLDLEDSSGTRFDRLSGGQKQRLSIALALDRSTSLSGRDSRRATDPKTAAETTRGCSSAHSSVSRSTNS